MTGFKFFLGDVRGQNGGRVPGYGYVTYGKSSQPDAEEGELEIHGTDAYKVAERICQVMNGEAEAQSPLLRAERAEAQVAVMKEALERISAGGYQTKHVPIGIARSALLSLDLTGKGAGE